MSGTLPANEPACLDQPSDCIELIIEARPRDLGGFEVRRVLPAARRRRVGPFVFFDQMGPAEEPPGSGFDVRPHPHIGLSTLTYLFDGEIIHRDSLGSLQAIRPGDVNWMTAGRGIVHSERSSTEARSTGFRLHGIQCWAAMPTAEEEREPSFEHHPASSIPRVQRPGALIDVVAGTAYGQRSPVGVLSPTLYVHARLDAQATLDIEEEHAERALYVVEGVIELEGRRAELGTMLVLRPGKALRVRALERTRVMLLGGADLGSDRFIEWNFVSSTKQRIEQAKEEWRAQRFPGIPGDDQEFIPLPTLSPPAR